MATELGSFLMELSYPLKKEEILEAAESKALPDDILGILEELPDREYDTVADIALETA